MDNNGNEPSPRQTEKMQERLKLYEGLTGVGRIDKIADDIWEWAGKEGKVFWVGDKNRIWQFEDRLPLWEYFKVLETIEVPERNMYEGRRPGRPGRPDDLRGRSQRPFAQKGGGGGMMALPGGQTIVIAEWKR